MIVTERERERERKREREREAETQAEGEAGSMHREPNVGFDPGSPGLHPGLKVALNHWATGGCPMEVFWSRDVGTSTYY